MQIPVAEAREGCDLLIERIRRHADDARVLWDAGRYPGAFLPVLLGFEELGKLLEYVQVAATCEKAGLQVMEVTDFRNHGPRAAHSAKASLSTEYFQRGLHLVAWAMRVVGLPEHVFGGYDDHLRAIGADFARLRSTSMYVDYVDGTWTRGKPVDPETLESDIVALQVVAALIEALLKQCKSFSEVVDLSVGMEHEIRQKLPEAIRAIVAGIAEQVQAWKR